MLRTLAWAMLLGYVPGALVYRLPLAQREHRAALPADERVASDVGDRRAPHRGPEHRAVVAGSAVVAILTGQQLTRSVVSDSTGFYNFLAMQPGTYEVSFSMPGFEKLVQGDVRHCPFGKPFDLIGMFDVLEHVPEDLETLRALRDALAPGGRLMLTVPAHQYLWSYFDEAARHCRRYSSREIRERLVEAGFEVEFQSQFMTCIFPLVWLFRRVSSWNQRPGPEDAKALTLREFRVVPVINGLLAALLRLEALWLSRGYRLPIGTSLIVVARRTS